MKKVLTIAGSDCSGGAGIQADIKTICAHKMYAMSVITSLTAQNTTGVYAISDCEAEFVAKQLDCIFTDIYPDAIKIGMVSDKKIINVISEKLKEYKSKNIVIDPVMISTSGSKLLSDDAIQSLKENLLPFATLITPNIPEAEVLSGVKISSESEMIKSAEIMSNEFRCAVLVKGGHSKNNATDILYCNYKIAEFESERINNSNTHGTGCTLSSAIACGLADGLSLEESINNAKKYLTGALRDGLDLGNGSGPLNHLYNINIK